MPKSGTGTRGRGRRDESSGTWDAGTRDVGNGDVTPVAENKKEWPGVGGGGGVKKMKQ